MYDIVMHNRRQRKHIDASRVIVEVVRVCMFRIAEAIQFGHRCRVGSGIEFKCDRNGGKSKNQRRQLRDH